MSIAINLRHKVDLQTPQQVRHIGTLINQNDSGAHHVVLELTDGGAPAQLDGYTVVGAFARADGNVVMLGGTIDGSIVDVELTSACYAVPGPCMLSIKLTGEEMRTVYKAAGSVDTETDGELVTDEEYTTFDEMVGKIVENYLRDNPVQAEENDPTVPEWAKQPEPPKYTKADVGLSNVQNVKQYSASNPPPYPVTSVNGETGDVVIEVSAEAVGLENVDNVRQYSASNPPPYPVRSVNGMTGDVIIQATGGDGGITIETDPTVPAWAKEVNPPTYSKTDVGLGNVDNVKQYSESNPPPYPVTSVNGQTGDVKLELGGNVELYRVGDIYITTNSTSPASIFGGTWEQIKDRFLLGAGTSYTAGKTGGAATHTLTENEMPRHYHALNQQVTSGSATTLGIWATYFKSNYQVLDQTYEENQGVKAIAYGTGAVGGNAAHNNMPPYLTVYIWKRVA